MKAVWFTAASYIAYAKTGFMPSEARYKNMSPADRATTMRLSQSISRQWKLKTKAARISRRLNGESHLSP
jgi:hypothetical protein